MMMILRSENKTKKIKWKNIFIMKNYFSLKIFFDKFANIERMKERKK
jgi:hypothetical protein